MQFDNLLLQLEVCHHEKLKDINITTFAFLHNDANPKTPIKWIPSTNPKNEFKYLQQLHVLLSSLGYTTNYYKKQKVTNGQEKTITCCYQAPKLAQLTYFNMQNLHNNGEH